MNESKPSALPLHEAAQPPAPRPSGLRLAAADLVQGFASVQIWSMLAWQEVKQRYRRSLLGPLWITISTGVMIGAMGPLFAKLFNQDMASYLAFLAVGFVVWQLLSQIIYEGCQAFIAAEGFIKQIRLPLSVYVLRVVWKNVLMFAHNFPVVLVVFAFLPPKTDWQLLLFPVGLLIIAVNGVWIGLVVALLCTRFRDIPPIIASVVQIAFFLSPVMWQPKMLGRHEWAVDFNPIYHFIEIVRGPLLGELFRPLSWAFVLFTTVIGYAFALALYAKYRARVAYWV